jgi:tripartite-type tricarboxylate transporter receptor subunit TctC
MWRARCSAQPLKVQFELVHYRGGGPGVAALVSGESQFGTPTMASSLGQVRGGGVRALAVLAEQRSPALPDVPSAPEAGMPGVMLEEFFPILAPKRHAARDSSRRSARPSARRSSRARAPDRTGRRRAARRLRDLARR